MFHPRLGVSLNAISHELTEDVIQAIGTSQIATIELSPSLFDEDKQGATKCSLKNMLRSTGIRIMTVHALFGDAQDFSALDEGTYQEAIATTSASIDLAGEFGAPTVVVHASFEPIGPQERNDRLAQARRALVQIGERAQEAGKRIAVELLPRTCLGNTIEELFTLLDGFDEDTFGICLDVNHGMDRYQDLAEDVRRLGDRLIALHLSDYDGVDEKHWLPGKGVIDWKSFMEGLRDVGYDGPFNYECRLEGATPKERIQSLEKNFAWLCKFIQITS
jgi:sugar phosphate isomerase/epimerase